MANGGYVNIRVPQVPISEQEEQLNNTLSSNRLDLTKSSLIKSNYNNVINTSFSELTPPPPPVEETVSVSQFFNLYDELFYEIPTEGDLNSHEFLIERSSEYIGFTEQTPEEIQALLDEITILRKNLLDTEQELLEVRSAAAEAGVTDITSTGDNSIGGQNIESTVSAIAGGTTAGSSGNITGGGGNSGNSGGGGGY
jgi:hypothetical protein